MLNNLKHEATHHTPSEIFCKNLELNPILEIVKFPENIENNPETKLILAREVQATKAVKRRERHNNKINPIKYKIGDLVLVRTHKQSNAFNKHIYKFFLLYEGPYVILERKNENAYVLIHDKSRLVRGTFNCIHLKKYHPPEDV